MTTPCSPASLKSQVSVDPENVDEVGFDLFLGTELPLNENHEFPAVAFQQGLDELRSESRKTVPVSDHNAELISCVYSLQYGEQPLAPEVEAGTGVADDLSIRVSLSHERDLRVEVC